ncbi:MAG: histidinol-phosphatase HisJ family protein [Clostridia bacterium]|nr:histidinol-phosphatase HisJ family protein [Clostridia bacterium]
MQDIITQLNALSKAARARPLTPEESAKRQHLRQMYIASFRTNLTAQLDSIDILNPDGSVTNLSEKKKNKIFADQHIHSNLSTDSSVPAASYASAARKKGLTHLTLTQHYEVDYPNPLFLAPPSVAAMVTAAEELAAAAPEITVGLGVECGYGQPVSCVESFLMELYKTKKLDFVLLSVHSVRGTDPYEERYFEGRTLRQAYRAYLEALLESVQSGLPYHAVGHFGYVSKYSGRPILEAEDFPALCDEILQTIIKEQKAMEINTSSIPTKGQPLAPSSILKRYAELGGRLITFGSDAHAPENLGQCFTQARQIALDCGLTEYAIYTKGEPKMAPLQF